MAFVRVKGNGSRKYYYLVETHRENGKVQQRHLVYLGNYSTVGAALAGLPKDIAAHQKRAEQLQGAADKYREVYLSYYPDSNEIPRPGRSGHMTHRRLCGQYWSRQDGAAAASKWQKEAENRLAKIQAVVYPGREAPATSPIGLNPAFNR